MARYAVPRAVSIMIAGLFALTAPALAAKFETVAKDRADKMGCLSCHEGIEQFTDGPMMETIIDLGKEYKDPGGCVICHGGTPSG